MTRLVAAALLLAACATGGGARREPEMSLDVVSKEIDFGGGMWERYIRPFEPRGSGFILTAKFGKACQVSRREWINAEQGRAFSCAWRNPR